MNNPPSMSRHIARLCVAGAFSLAILSGCSHQQKPDGYAKNSATVPARCTAEWNRLVDRRLQISDPSGHGPDVGSAEWMNAVGEKSGVYDASGHGPDPGSDEWCRAVDYKVFGRR